MSIKYMGNVTVKKYKRGRLTAIYTNHNGGTWNLFSLICSNLYGEMDTMSLPQCIDVGYPELGSGGEVTNYVSVLNNKVDVTDRLISLAPSNALSEDDECSITFTFRVTNDSINFDVLNGAPDDTPTTYLLKDDYDTVLATMSVDSDAEGADIKNFYIAPDEVFVVEWQVKLGNATN